MMCSIPPGRWRAEPALAALPRSRSAPRPEKPAKDFYDHRRTIEAGALITPAHRAGSSLSRTAGEGAESSEAGEGGRRSYLMRLHCRAGGVRQTECADTAARR